MFKKKNIVQEKIHEDKKTKTANEWMPIADISKNIAYRKDGKLLGILKIEPVNISLLSAREKKRKISMLSEILNGETEPIQIFCIGRPVDLNSYIDYLNDKVKSEVDFTRKMVLKNYLKESSRIASNGEITERRFYMIISQGEGAKAERELKERLSNLVARLEGAELRASICEDDEILDMFSQFSSPQAGGRIEMKIDLPSVLYN